MGRKASPKARQSGRRLRRPFRPAAAFIVAGEFQGKRVDELTVEELSHFITFDARSQPHLPGSWQHPATPVGNDAPYWCARFELQRRTAPTATAPTIEIKPTDTVTRVAEKMIKFAYRAASQKHHPDAGGTDEVQKRINAARELLLKSVRRGR